MLRSSELEKGIVIGIMANVSNVNKILEIATNKSQMNKYFIIGNIMPKFLDFLGYSIEDIVYSETVNDILIDLIVTVDENIIPIMCYSYNMGEITVKEKEECKSRIRECLFNNEHILYGIITNGVTYTIYIRVNNDIVEFDSFSLRYYDAIQGRINRLFKQFEETLRYDIEQFARIDALKQFCLDCMTAKNQVFLEFIEKSLGYSYPENVVKKVFNQIVMDNVSLINEGINEEKISVLNDENDNEKDEEDVEVKSKSMIKYGGKSYSIPSIVNSKLSIKEKLDMLRKTPFIKYSFNGIEYEYKNYCQFFVDFLNYLIKNYSKAYDIIKVEKRNTVTFQIITTDLEEYNSIKDLKSRNPKLLCNDDLLLYTAGSDGLYSKLVKLIKVVKDIYEVTINVKLYYTKTDFLLIS